MIQEEGYIKVQAYKSTSKWIRWIRPVKRVSIEMVFDVYAWTFMSQGLDLPFSEFDQIPPEDYLPWAIYGGCASHASLSGKRGMKIEEIHELVRGIISEDRDRIMNCIVKSRLYGKTIEEYSEAAAAKGSKKAPPLDQRS